MDAWSLSECGAHSENATQGTQTEEHRLDSLALSQTGTIVLPDGWRSLAAGRLPLLGEVFWVLYGDSHLVEEGKMAGYEMTERFFEIGSPQDLAETSAYLLARASACSAPPISAV